MVEGRRAKAGLSIECEATCDQWCKAICDQIERQSGKHKCKCTKARCALRTTFSSNKKRK